MVSIVDRLVYEKFNEEERTEFVTAFAVSLASTMHDNRMDVSEPGDYRSPFIALLNERTSDYAECSFSKEEGASFTMRRILGNNVRDVMGGKDNKWIPDYVMDVEAPKAVSTLKRALPTLFM